MRHEFIWYVIITAIQKGIDPKSIHYVLKEHRVSPLAEYMPKNFADLVYPLLTADELVHVDVNPFWRFGFIPIFEKILAPGRSEPNDTIICDVITHILADADRICGMCGRDFQILLVMEDIAGGCFGDRQTAALFSIFEKRVLAEAVIMLYRTSDSVSCLTSLFTMIMTDTIISDRDLSELVFYNPNRFDEREDRKLRFIIKIFLPVSYSWVIHWQYTYGIIEREESMTLEAFVL